MNHIGRDEMIPSNEHEHRSSDPAESQDRLQLLGQLGSYEHSNLSARFFRALGDPTRIRILQELVATPSGEASVGELVARIGATQSRTSTHLGCLRWCGLVECRRVGKQIYYRVADARVRDLLALADRILRGHAAGVASCGVVR